MADQSTTIPKGWKITTLGEVGITVTGKTPSKDNPEDWGDFLDFITPTDISSDSKYLKTVARKLSEEGMNRFKKMIIPSKSVVVTCIGSDMGKVVMNENEALTNQQINSIKINSENDKDYIFYLLKDSYSILRNIAVGGSTMPILNKTTFESLEFLIPSLPEQHAIAAVLSSLDDKIELLREQNKTLEATVQAIFKEWFVNFNFPGATGKMVDSELGEIPEGWKVDRLSEIIVFEGGAQPPKSEHIYEPRDGYVRFIQNRDYSNSSHITYIKESKKNKLCEVFDIMMDKYGDVGVPRWGLVGAYNVALAKIVPKIKNSREYLRSYFSQRAVFSLLSASAQASTRGSLNEGTFKGVTLIIPDEITLERFEKLQSKFLSKILFNNAEVETLSQLRDTLLPKLMKGDVRVEGFEN